MHNSNKSCTFASDLVKGLSMSTVTIQIPSSQIGWFEQMVKSMGWSFSRTENPAKEQRPSVTPAMRRRINQARKELATGETIAFKTPQEMQQYFDSL